jgi:IS30 family transposase
MGKCRYLNYEQRKTIEKLLKKGIKPPSIAPYIGCSASAVYRELKRCEDGKYSADEAQKGLIVVKGIKYE